MPMRIRIISFVSVLLVASALSALGPIMPGDQDVDRKVKAFLDSRRGQWHDLNVSDNDGKILYDLVLKNGYKRALDIGTSTGHSAIWLAWALSKTDGKLITIEIDEAVYKQAVANFLEAGVANIIDARLANAHDLVPSLAGPFDLVFCDADKGWYKKYFLAVLPKLELGGCFAAHNITEGTRGWVGPEFLAYVKGLPYMETTFPPGSAAGISISYKRAPDKGGVSEFLCKPLTRPRSMYHPLIQLFKPFSLRRRWPIPQRAVRLVAIVCPSSALN